MFIIIFNVGFILNLEKILKKIKNIMKIPNFHF